MENMSVASVILGNASTHEDSYGPVQAGILIPVSFVIVAGNLLTILAVCRTPRLRTVPNMYIVSLSVADILAGLSCFYASLSLIPQLTQTFDSNMFLCLSRYIFVYMSVAASVANLEAIAVDRYLYIVHSLRYSSIVTSFRAAGVIAVTWVFAFIWGTVPVYVNTWQTSKRCLMFVVLSLEYQVCLVGVLFGLGSVVILICYGSIARAAMKQINEIENTTVRSEDDGTTQMTSKAHKDWKIIKMLFTVFGVFFVCWSPSAVGVLAATRQTVSETYMGFAITVGLLNSGMNVFIYAKKNQDFREAFADILGKLRCRPKRGPRP